MKMNANGGKGSHGRSRSIEKDVLKKIYTFKECSRLNLYEILTTGLTILDCFKCRSIFSKSLFGQISEHLHPSSC